MVNIRTKIHGGTSKMVGRSRNSIDTALEVSSGAAVGTLLAAGVAGALANGIPLMLGGPLVGGIVGAVAGKMIGDFIQQKESTLTIARKRALVIKRKKSRSKPIRKSR